MNEKIKQLIKELGNECKKQNVTLSLGAFSEDGRLAIAQQGSKGNVKLAMDVQIETWIKILEECGCAGCKARLAELDGDDEETDCESLYDNDLSAKLAKFLQGEGFK